MIRRTLGLAVMALLMFGCSKSTNPLSAGSTGNVTMAVAFNNGGAPGGLGKIAATVGTDSIRIDSAIVIFARIKFESHVDSVSVDSSNNSTVISVDDSEANYVFRGPFVVHVRDTSSINFANQALPAGTYTGISFFIHRIGSGEGFEDSDDFNHHQRTGSDSAATNYSIVVWGSIFKNGTWTPFEFKDNENIEFKVKGTFVVPASSSSIDVALNFNMGAWFISPYNGMLLDPTDMSEQNQEMIRQAIHLSFEQGRCGHYDEMHHDFFGD